MKNTAAAFFRVMDELILSDIDVVGKRVAALEKSGKVVGANV